jgi:hypothetical protein
MMEKEIWIENNYQKKFNQQITMDFLMIRFRHYFQKSQSWSFFKINICLPLTCMIYNFLDG